MIRRALPTPAHKHRPARADYGATTVDPNGLLAAAGDVAASCLPHGPSRSFLSPGLGFDVLDLVRAGVHLVQDPLGALTDLARAGLGELITQIPGRFFEVLDEWGGLIAAGWRLLENIPIIGRYLAMVRTLASNFLDRVIFGILGDISDLDDPGVGNVQCPTKLPSSVGRLRYQTFCNEVAGGQEIAPRIWSILKEVLPDVYSFNDDAPALDWDGFDWAADLDSDGKTWDVIDARATDVDGQLDLPGAHTMYVKAWKISNRRIFVEVGQLRAVSFIACSRPDTSLEFEHEGDGERFYAHLQVDPTDEADPAGSELATVRLTGLIGTGHEDAHWYAWDDLYLEPADGGRAGMGVARGSHSTSIAQGRTLVGDKKWYFQLVLDYYPGPGTAGSRGRRAYAAPTDAATLKQLYDSSGEKWGKDKVFGDPYDAWGPGCGLVDSEDTADTCSVEGGDSIETQFTCDLAKNFPLNPLDAAACRNGANCSTCEQPVDLKETARTPPASTSMVETRASQEIDDLVA